MAGLRTVVPDALPAPGGAAVLAALAATLLASLAAGLWLSRADVLPARHGRYSPREVNRTSKVTATLPPGGAVSDTVVSSGAAPARSMR